MGESLILMRRQGRFSLSLRTHDLGGTDYSTLCSLTEQQAHALEGPHTGLYFLHDVAPTVPPAEKRELNVLRRTDRPANTRAWSLCVGSEHAAFITDEAVALLQEHVLPVFESGEPNWKTREIENLDDQIVATEATLDALRKRRQELMDAPSTEMLDPD